MSVLCSFCGEPLPSSDAVCRACGRCIHGFVSEPCEVCDPVAHARWLAAKQARSTSTPQESP